MWSRGILCVVLIMFYHFEGSLGGENNQFFLKASKNVPRIGRNSKSNADFEKFFLKASKSVPRIGRRNEVPFALKEGIADETINKYPTWSEIATEFEYYPEIFNSETLDKLEKELGDDPSVYDWDKVRLKREIPARFLI